MVRLTARSRCASWSRLRNAITIALAIGVAAPFMARAQEACTPTVAGDLRVFSITSKIYERDVTLRVWLPPGYATAPDSVPAYPTLYFLDGQTAFDECTAFKGEHELRLDETLTMLIEAGTVPPMIVVGVDSGNRRTHEYAPYHNPITDAASPEPVGKRMPSFIVDEVIPAVGAKFRVSKDASHVGIGGTSLGASAALSVALSRPDIFGLALLQSPNVLLGNGQLLRDTADLARAPDRVAIGTGGRELDFPDIDAYLARFRLTRAEAEAGGVRMTRTLVEHLKAAAIKQSHVLLVIEPGANHSSQFWAGRMPAALTFLYGPPPTP